MAKRPTKNVTFGPLILSFPKITEKDEKYGVYSANGVEDPNSAAMKAAKALLAEAKKEFGLEDAEDLTLPLTKEMTKDPNAPEGTRKPKKVPTGKLLLKSKSQQPPAVFDSKGREINPRGLDIRGGTLARVQGFLAPYDMNGKEGISFTLTGVQILKLAQRRGSDGFDAFDLGDDEEGFTLSGDTSDGLELAEDSGTDEDTQSDDGGLDI